jgi:hypothetical protein
MTPKRGEKATRFDQVNGQRMAAPFRGRGKMTIEDAHHPSRGANLPLTEVNCNLFLEKRRI